MACGCGCCPSECTWTREWPTSGCRRRNQSECKVMAFRKVAQFKEVSLQYVAVSGGTFKFLTDMPGGHLLERTGGKAIPASNADKTPATTTIPLIDGNGAPLEGTIHQERVDPPFGATVQLRSGVLLMRTIGVYLDGSLGEFWESLPASVGV